MDPTGLPSPDEATQFCMMLQAGLPAGEAIRYFTAEEDPATLGIILRKWRRCREVARAWKVIQGKSWTDMTLDEKMRAGLDMAYAGLAFVLYNTNYAEASASEKAKLDTARTAIEQKLAGTAGAGDPMSRFIADMQAGKWAGMISPGKPS